MERWSRGAALLGPGESRLARQRRRGGRGRGRRGRGAAAAPPLPRRPGSRVAVRDDLPLGKMNTMAVTREGARADREF